METKADMQNEEFEREEMFDMYPEFNDLEGLNAFMCGLEASFFDESV